MFILEKALIILLRGYLNIPEDKIFTGSRHRPIDRTPCITIQQATEVQIGREIIPGKTEVIQTKNNVEVWINIWANTEEERNSLLSQVETRIFQALANHYTTCDNFNERHCNFLDGECEALTVINGRTAKNQCPYPHKNQYTSWFKKYHIIKPSFTISGRQDMDELDLSQPVLRTLIKLDMDYYRNYGLGGHELEDIIIDEELL